MTIARLTIGMITGIPSNNENTYIPGSGVGGTSRSARAALRRRATLNPGTMANPKTGICKGFCNPPAVVADTIIIPSGDTGTEGFIFLIDDTLWDSILEIPSIGLDTSKAVPVIPNSMQVHLNTNYSSTQTRVRVVYESSATTVQQTGFTMNQLLGTMHGAGITQYDITILQWGAIPPPGPGPLPFANDPLAPGLQFSSTNLKWSGDISCSDVPLFLTGTSLISCFANVTIPSANFGNIGSWDVSAVINMASMFSGATNFNQDISNWNVSTVTNMYYMFYQVTAFNGDISNWNVSNVENMEGLFRSTTFNGDISNWTVSNVLNMTNMFRDAAFNGDISTWDVANVEILDSLFKGTNFFNGNITNWDTGNVNNILAMFENATGFTQDLSWNVSNVINMRYVFNGATIFNGNVTTWDVTSVTDMTRMFYNASIFNQDLSTWNMTNQPLINDMFTGTISLSTANNDKIYNAWVAHYSASELTNAGLTAP